MVERATPSLGGECDIRERHAALRGDLCAGGIRGGNENRLEASGHLADPASRPRRDEKYLPGVFCRVHGTRLICQLRGLLDHDVRQVDFNSYGTRRGNHEVMVRGTFANIRLRNQLAPGTEGGITLHLPDGRETSIFEASEQYHAEGVPLMVLAGKEYGSGSSRDWAAKGTRLLGVRAVIAESYERIHRSNLIGMGVLPLQYTEGQTAESLGLTGHEVFAVTGIGSLNEGVSPKTVAVTATDGDRTVEFEARLRIDTPMEAQYYRHGGILPYMLRQMAG